MEITQTNSQSTNYIPLSTTRTFAFVHCTVISGIAACKAHFFFKKFTLIFHVNYDKFVNTFAFVG